MIIRILKITSCALLFLLTALGTLYCQDEGPIGKGPVKVTRDERNIYVNGELYYIKGVSYSLNYGPKQNFKTISYIFGMVPTKSRGYRGTARF